MSLFEERYYVQDGYVRYGTPKLMFDNKGRVYLGEPWPSVHTRCVLDARGQVRRRPELMRCNLCELWWDIYEMSKAGGQGRPSGRGSYCLVCFNNYHKWRKQMLNLGRETGLTKDIDVTVPSFRKWYQAGELDVKPPAQMYPEDYDVTAT